MKSENSYNQGYNFNDNSIDYLKYGIFNEYGLNIDRCLSYYDEEKIIKKRCNIKNRHQKM